MKQTQDDGDYIYTEPSAKLLTVTMYIIRTLINY